MSSSFRSDSVYSVEIDELLELGTTCRELTKENVMMRESLLRERLRSSELIKRLELDLKKQLEAHLIDKKYIDKLERKLKNCTLEIGYLQDQLNLKNIEANCLNKRVQSLEFKLAEAGKLHDQLNCLKDILVESDSQRLTLQQRIEEKQGQLENSALHIQELERTISSMTLEYQCEIECMRLDLTTLERRLFEAQKSNEQSNKEKGLIDELIEEFDSQCSYSKKIVDCLEDLDLQEKFMISKEIIDKVEGTGDVSDQNGPSFAEQDNQNQISDPEQLCSTEGAKDVKDKMESMTFQIQEYESLIMKLKEELKHEKMKAKEEGEDLIQEMAELRYQVMGMLEEECKRRACIEQASLRRISVLEDEIQEEKKKSFLATKHFHEAQRLINLGNAEIHQLKKALAEFHSHKSLLKISSRTCNCGNCELHLRELNSSNEELTRIEDNMIHIDDEDCQPRITWYSLDTLTDKAPNNYKSAVRITEIE